MRPWIHVDTDYAGDRAFANVDLGSGDAEALLSTYPTTSRIGMKTAITTGILSVAGAVAFGTLAFGTGQTANAGTDDVILNKREDTAVSWVVADDDDGDDNTRSRNSRTDGPSHDNTNSASRQLM